MLALKLCLTPLLILAASLASRRWGSVVGGWLVGLPLTSGPLSFFLALDQGPAFAQQAAAGTLAGTAAQACFSVAYFWAAEWVGWPLSLCAGAFGFLACAMVLQVLAPPALGLFALALLTLTVGLVLTPRREVARGSAAPPAWDIPARMVVATTLVLSVTASAPLLGPRLSGVIASFPIFAAVLAVFAHHGQGAGAGRLVVRGLIMGLFGFACFFEAVNLLVTRLLLGQAFVIAGLAAMLVQGTSFVMMRRERPLALPAAEDGVTS